MSTVTTRKTIKVPLETYNAISREGTVADSFGDVVAAATVIMSKVRKHIETKNCQHCKDVLA